MQPLKANLHWKMKDMRVAVKVSTYQLLSDVTPESTLFQMMTTPHFTLPLHVAQVPASHITSQSIASYQSVSSEDEESPAVDISPPYNTTSL